MSSKQSKSNNQGPKRTNANGGERGPVLDTDEVVPDWAGKPLDRPVESFPSPEPLVQFDAKAFVAARDAGRTLAGDDGGPKGNKDLKPLPEAPPAPKAPKGKRMRKPWLG